MIDGACYKELNNAIAPDESISSFNLISSDGFHELSFSQDILNINTENDNSGDSPLNNKINSSNIEEKRQCIEPNKANNVYQSNDIFINHIINKYIFQQSKNKKHMLNKSFLKEFVRFIKINYFQLINLQIKYTSKCKIIKIRKFSFEEDDMIKKIVYTFGAKNWKLIASLIPGRTPRQCRDRYANYLAPGFIHSHWSNEENKLLTEKFSIYGSQWSKIQHFFPYKTVNELKNRFNYFICKKNGSNKANHDLEKDHSEISLESNDKSIINNTNSNIEQTHDNNIDENNQFFSEHIDLFDSNPLFFNNGDSLQSETEISFDYFH